MSKITPGQVKLLLLLLIVVLLFGAYRFGYQPINEKNEAVKAEIEDYTAKIRVLDAKITRKAEFEEGIKSVDAKAYKVFDLYGGGNTNEKTIMMLVALEEASEMSISNVSFGADTNIYYTNSVKSSTGLGVYMFRQPLTISYRVTYDGMKKAIDFITEYKERMTIESVTASYDTLTGQLTGTMVLNLYSVIGGNAEYTAPSTGVTEFGTENIFGSFEPVESEEENNGENANTENQN